MVRPLACLLGVLVLTALPRCSGLIDPGVPEPIRSFQEPDFGNPYLLYRPSNYDRQSAWPLIVVCYGGLGDSPHKRIRQWSPLAERYGFLVAAPDLTAPRRSRFSATPNDDPHHIQEYEVRILSTVRHIQAGHTISDDRILIHGLSTGAAPALFVGLRNPDVFRAVAVSQPRVDEDALATCLQRVDPHQPILTRYEQSDVLTGKHAGACTEALRRAGVELTEDRTTWSRDTDPDRVIEFFLHALRTSPWIRIRTLAAASGDLLDIQFRVRCSFRPRAAQWDFGDGRQAQSLEPIHRFAAPGDYTVALTVEDSIGRQHRRAIRLSLPDGLTTPVAPSVPDAAPP